MLLCGANAVNGSSDCVNAAALTLTPGPTGVVSGTLPVFIPPAPCPCVVLVTSLAAAYSTTIPVEVVGATTAPIVRKAAPGPPKLQVSSTVDGGTTLASVVGGPASRTLVVTIKNTGDRAAERVLVTGRWGRSGSVNNVIPTHLAGRIRAGGTRTVKLGFELDPLSIGSYDVAGVVTGGAKPVAFKASTSTWPWGLLIIALIILQLVLLAFRNRARRRLARKEAAAELAAVEPAEEIATPAVMATASVSAADPLPTEIDWTPPDLSA